jgi:hypothetical protein
MMINRRNGVGWPDRGTCDRSNPPPDASTQMAVVRAEAGPALR